MSTKVEETTVEEIEVKETTVEGANEGETTEETVTDEAAEEDAAEQAAEEAEKEQQQLFYTTEIERLDATIADYRSQMIDADIKRKLKRAHYTDEQIERYVSVIKGDTDAEINTSIKLLMQDIPPKVQYVDPSPDNGVARKRGTKTGRAQRFTNLGRSLASKTRRKGVFQ